MFRKRKPQKDALPDFGGPRYTFPNSDLPQLDIAQSYSGLSHPPYDVAWSADGRLLAANAKGQIVVWSMKGELLGTMAASRLDGLPPIDWHPVRPALAVSRGAGKVAEWNPASGDSRDICHPKSTATGLAWTADGSQLAVAEDKGVVALWDAESGQVGSSAITQGPLSHLAWSWDGEVLAGLGSGGIVEGISASLFRALYQARPAGANVHDIAFSASGEMLAIATDAGLIEIVDPGTAMRLFSLEGYFIPFFGVRFSPDSRFLAALTWGEAWIWRCRDWELVARAVIPGQDARDTQWGTPGGLAFHPSEPLLAVKDVMGDAIHCYQLDYSLLDGIDTRPATRRYVNAKVVLLGDTGVGKSGLGLVLSGQPYQKTDSTHGRNVWMFESQEVDKPETGAQTQEVLLWDLAGQPGYRLIHQLHLNEVAAALIVFDSRSETDPFSGVKHWVRALAQARRLEGPAAVPMKTFLVAARADRGGVAVTGDRVQGMLGDFGLDEFFETSAKEGWKIAELAAAIRDGIQWGSLPMVSSNELFQSIREFLLEEKQQGRLLSTRKDLFLSFRRAHPDMPGEGDWQASFNACIGRVESRGLISRLEFGDLVLLQPELLDAYASGMIQAAKEEPDGLGFIPEEEAIEGRFRMADSERVADRAQEKLLLIATVEELLRHEIALREVTDRGVDLVFPSQFTREQPHSPDVSGKRVIITFEGPLRSIYATLAVRLSQSTLFQRQAMWNNAAAYTATGGGTCGIHLRELDEGRGELALFHDAQAGQVVRAQFETYVEDYLRLRALPGTVTVRRVRICPDATCGYVLPDDLVRRKLERGTSAMTCPDCERAVISLSDERPATAASAYVDATDEAVAEMNRSADLRRDLNVAETRLQGKRQTSDFDVFLCYHSKDREQVKAIGEQLKVRGLLPWLDIWEIPPGTRWQPELKRTIKSVKSAAVFIGPGAPGPWQGLEVETILNELTKRRRPVIPVILDGRQGRPRLPDFLSLWHVVDMREPDPDPFEQLVWGITGQRPMDA